MVSVALASMVPHRSPTISNRPFVRRSPIRRFIAAPPFPPQSDAALRLLPVKGLIDLSSAHVQGGTSPAAVQSGDGADPVPHPDHRVRARQGIAPFDVWITTDGPCVVPLPRTHCRRCETAVAGLSPPGA